MGGVTAILRSDRITAVPELHAKLSQITRYKRPIHNDPKPDNPECGRNKRHDPASPQNSRLLALTPRSNAAYAATVATENFARMRPGVLAISPVESGLLPTKFSPS